MPCLFYQQGAPLAPSYVYETGLPVLGICYGMQAITKQLGGKVSPGTKQEYGHAILHIGDKHSPLLAGLDDSPPVWMSQIPPGFAGPVSPVDEWRADASAWLERLPVIEEFRRRVLARRAERRPG